MPEEVEILCYECWLWH